jgi:hypothetical protein
MIAATSAQGSTEGFLKPRPQRQYSTFADSSGVALYACDDIDDFHRDVDEGGLNQRGWVLQERILSSRTVHFTATQLYWECGIGVRCETLTRMKNTEASVLGDPAFPSLWRKRSHANSVRLFSILFERYSKLSLTYAADRPAAISAVARQLSLTFGGGVKHGVFLDYVGRSLTWQRHGPRELKRIAEPTDRGGVPSWSWMAHDGEIRYLGDQFGKIEWNGHGSRLVNGSEVPARSFQRESPEYGLVFDHDRLAHDHRYGKSLRCVVLGRSARVDPAWNPAGRRYYVMIVAPVSSGKGGKIYERIGAGSIQEERLGEVESPVRVI